MAFVTTSSSSSSTCFQCSGAAPLIYDSGANGSKSRFRSKGHSLSLKKGGWSKSVVSRGLRWSCMSEEGVGVTALQDDGVTVKCPMDDHTPDSGSIYEKFCIFNRIRCLDKWAFEHFFAGVKQKEPSVATVLVSSGNSFDPYDAMSTPLYQTATFKQPSATENGPYDYTRSGNPTRDVLESLLAKLEKADRALCFTSGMAALAAVTHLVEIGQEIVAGDDIYGGSDRLLSRVAPKKGIVVKRIDTSDLSEVASAISPKTRLVWLESPTNPRQRISDIWKISEMAHTHGALVMIDNSIMSPVLCQPLELGADIVMHSATKFLAGHSDLMAGVLAVKGDSLSRELAFLQNAEGSGLAPFDCWLCLRGMKTMSLRIEKQQANAQKIAEFLSTHPCVKKVNYAGLPDHPGRLLHYSQAKGAGSVLSFSTGSLALSKHIVENLKYFSITVSFGSVKSLVSLPCFMSHASIPADVRESRGLTEDLVRISVGIEDVEDLISDLESAFNTGPA